MSDILVLKFDDGFTQKVKLPAGHGKIKRATPYYSKYAASALQPEVNWNFSGLWVTDTIQFVEIQSNRYAWVLDSKGEKTARVSITAYGEVYQDGLAPFAKLIERRRGEESKTFDGRITWPIVKMLKPGI